MKKHYIALFIPLFVFALISTVRAEDTYKSMVYGTDIELYSFYDEIPTMAALKVSFDYIQGQFGNWFDMFDYAVENLNSTQFVVHLIDKTDPRTRYFYAKIESDTSRDIDEWRLISSTSADITRYRYIFTKSSGAYVSRTQHGSAIDQLSSGLVFYTNFKKFVRIGYYNVSEPITNTTLVEMNNIQDRPLPNTLLVSLGIMSNDGAIIADSITDNTNRQLNLLQQIHYNWLAFVFGNTTKANEYRDAIFSGNMDPSKDHVVNDIKNGLSGVFSLPEATFKYTRLLADTVIGIVTFAYKLIETALLLIVDTIALLVSVAVKAGSILVTLNSKLANTPTVLTPVYQSTFAIFPAIMGLGVVKFFFRIFRG
jgi:hypothetical protein